MPYQMLNLEEAARYLHLTSADVERRVKDREIPFEKRGGRIVFSNATLMLGLPSAYSVCRNND